jgi:hypothetical protein
MAELSNLDAGPVLQDDLMRDRARQFVEFLDDEVGFALVATMFQHGPEKGRTSMCMKSDEAMP